MSESRKTGFWIGLAAFELLFGVAVFGVTRHYYLSRREPALPQAASRPFPMAFPQAGRPATSALPDSPVDVALESPDVISQRADERFAAGDYTAAAALYERLVALDPTNVALLNNLGITLHYIGRSDEAIQRLDAGLAIDSGHQRSWLTLGFINSQLGQREEAHTALVNAVRLGPRNDVGQSAARMLQEMGFEVPTG
jgi:tetratricopeptide (TPR) repeat protein